MHKFIIGALLLAPALASAQLSNIGNLLSDFGDLVGQAIPIAVGLALLAFFWGLAKFIFAGSGGDEESKAQGKSLMIWGVVALFVMAGVWGLVGFIGEALDIDTQGGDVVVPGVQGL